jgi:hypothetical protein
MVYDTAGGGMSGVVEASNYIHGDFGLHNTTWIFNDDNTASMSGFLIYNNLLVNGSATHTANDGYIYGVPQGSFAYNNTIWGNGLGGSIFLGLGNGANVTIVNNLIANVKGFTAAIAPITLIDYNQYMDQAPWGCAAWFYGGGPCSGQATFAAWKAACNCDAHGAYNAPLTVNADGTLQAGSPAIGAGVNLTSLGIAALNVDAAGHARPSVGGWDVGAYQASPPPPPTSLHGVAR